MTILRRKVATPDEGNMTAADRQLDQDAVHRLDYCEG
jgi:hypothetical protein